MYRACVAMGLLISTTAVAAPQNALTETMAVQMGLSRGPVVQRTEGNIVHAQSEVIAAGTWPNPVFRYERETIGNGADIVEQKFVFSQRFDFSGRRGMNKQAADHHLNAARHKSDAWRAEITKKIRQRYYNALFQQQRREVYEDTQKRIRLLGKVIRKRREEGDVSIYDFQRVNTARAAIDAAVRNVGVDFHTEWQNLWALLGADPRDFRSLEGELVPGPIPSLEELTESVVHQPGLRQLSEKTEAYRLQERAENRTFPEVTFDLGLKREEINSLAENGWVLNASIPILVFDKRKDKQTRYQAEAMIAQSKYQLAYDAARAEIRGLWLQSTQYQRSAEVFREEAIQGAYDLIKIAEAYYRAGEVGILELLDAYRGALDAELGALDLEFKARSARINLDYLTGVSVP